MKRFYAMMLALSFLLMTAAALVGCAPKQNNNETNDESNVFCVYTSFYPIYALADMVIGDAENVQLNCLVQPQDGCLRSYQLSDWDLALLMRAADAVLIGGSGLESFESLLYTLGKDGPIVSAILYNMELYEKKAFNTQEDQDSHWNSSNPHIYMKIDGAIEITNRIAANLQLLDPENGEIYAKNAQQAQNRLKSLKEELKTSVGSLNDVKVAIFNEALVYTADEYGLSPAFLYDRESGESVEGADLENCLSALKNSGAELILIEKQAPQRFCEALEASGYRVVRLDTLSTRYAAEGWEGYFDALRENAATLKDAFVSIKK